MMTEFVFISSARIKCEEWKECDMKNVTYSVWRLLQCNLNKKKLLQQLSMVFGQIKKTSENVYISLKTESKHEVTQKLINSYKLNIKSFTWKLQKQPPDMFCEKRCS